MMRGKILVIDDDPDQLDLLHLVLTDEGFAIDTAANGLDGLKKMDLFRPDLVVLDASKPKMNGFSFCETIRKNPATAAVPVIMLTGLRSQFDRLNALAHGATAYLAKPFVLDELVAKVTELMGE